MKNLMMLIALVGFTGLSFADNTPEDGYGKAFAEHKTEASMDEACRDARTAAYKNAEAACDARGGKPGKENEFHVDEEDRTTPKNGSWHCVVVGDLECTGGH